MKKIENITPNPKDEWTFDYKVVLDKLNEVVYAVNELQERVDDIIATQNAVIDRMEIQRSDVEPAKKEDKPPFKED